MKRILLPIFIILLIPSMALTQAERHKTILVLPFTTMVNGKKTGFSDIYPQVLGKELENYSNYTHRYIPNLMQIIGKQKLTPARLARLAKRQGAHGVIWGSFDKSDKGYSLVVRYIRNNPRETPKTYKVTGEDIPQLTTGITDVARQIGMGVTNRPHIGKIILKGNQRIRKEAILDKLDIKPGTPFDETALGDEIRDLYSMGYFDDVQIRANKGSNSEVDLEILLKERPSVKEIDIEGNSVFTKGEILDKLSSDPYSVVNMDKISQDIEKIKLMYEKNGYYQPKIEYEIKELSRSESKLIFKIKEGHKSFLTELVFDGAKRLTPKELKKALKVLMQEKSWFWFLDQSGQFTREQLEQARQLLFQYYHDKGFIGVQIGAPRMDIEGKKVTVTYPIREGDRYQTRKVDVTGDLKMEKKKLIAKLKTKPKTWFQRSLVGKDIQMLTKLYNDLGYAYADVEPRQKVNSEGKWIDITYNIKKGRPVTIDRVIVRNNETTRDKVIRRALAIADGDLYNATAIDASKKHLESMDFFETVKIKTEPALEDDSMNVIVDVIEKKTGQLSAGMGLSSQEGAMANVSLKERNLMGLGIAANLKADISGRKSTYEGSLNYPWLFDIPLNARINGYNTVTQESYYVRKSHGFGLSAGYPIYHAWNLSVGVARDGSKLAGIRPAFGRSVTEYYAKYGVDAKKYLNTSDNSVSMALTRDTRNNGMIPSRGSRLTIGSRISGFGADVYYQRYFCETAYYHPLFWKAIMKVQANGSALVEWENQPIPFDRRILLGGISSIRGYQYGDIGPHDKYGSIMGGDRAMYATVECLVPIIERLNLHGVAFADVGNAWNVDQSPFPEDVKAGAGVGIRWVSPMGPIRIEYGWKLNPMKGQSPGAFAFAMGQLF